MIGSRSSKTIVSYQLTMLYLTFPDGLFFFAFSRIIDANIQQGRNRAISDKNEQISCYLFTASLVLMVRPTQPMPYRTMNNQYGVSMSSVD